MLKPQVSEQKEIILLFVLEKILDAHPGLMKWRICWVKAILQGFDSCFNILRTLQFEGVVFNSLCQPAASLSAVVALNLR